MALKISEENNTFKSLQLHQNINITSASIAVYLFQDCFSFVFQEN